MGCPEQQEGTCAGTGAGLLGLAGLSFAVLGSSFVAEASGGASGGASGVAKDPGHVTPVPVRPHTSDTAHQKLWPPCLPCTSLSRGSSRGLGYRLARTPMSV